MDIQLLADALRILLAPALPYLMHLGDKTAEGAARALGADTWKRARRVWEGLQPTVESREAAREAAEDLVADGDDLDAQAAFRRQLGKILAADPELAARLEVEVPPPVQIELRANATGQSSNAVGPGAVSAAGGSTAVGRDLIQLQLTVPSSEAFLHSLSPGLAAPNFAEATTRYLEHLVDRHQCLELRGMGISDRVPLKLPLLEMYVPLAARLETPEGDTWERLRGKLRIAGREPGEEEMEAMGRRLSAPRPVVELLRGNDGLIVLGDPGAGKTTLLKFLALTLASGRATDLGLDPKLPILVPLSAYATALAAGDVPLPEFIARYYHDRGIDLPLGPMLEQALGEGGALLLLDGLDEVRERRLKRVVVDRVVDFFTLHRRAGNRFILTSRVIGYREVRPAAEGLLECTLADFDDDEIESFVGRWTAAVERAATGASAAAAAEAEREREELLRAVRSNPSVRLLASNPLLLTILALMKRQGVSLPDRRVELYQKYVETLIRNWNLARSLDRPPVRELDVVETTRVLAPLALWMHETSPGVGLVKEQDCRRRLETIFAERGVEAPETAAARFLEDVRDHTGLLVDRGGHQLGFVHLTFQEYLAAVAIAQRGQQDVGPVADVLAQHLGEEPWHEASLLAVGYLGIVQGRDEAASELLRELLRRAPGEPGQVVALAGEAVADVWPGGVTAACREETIAELRRTMVNDQRVRPLRRAAAGRALARVGDPRPEVVTLAGMQLCWVPPGPFWMGSDERPEERPQHRLDLPYEFWIGRYPVTVAQYREFVERSGFETGDGHALEGDTNAPVVWVSWQEAVHFCDWWTAELERNALLLDGWRVTLPSEAEWEKAARGALKVPAGPVIAHWAGVGANAKTRMLANPEPKRHGLLSGWYEPVRLRGDVWERMGVDA